MTVRQAGLKGTQVSGQYAPYAKVATTEGVVIAVRFIDDERNISKTYVEYDVRDLRTGQIYNNCRRSDETAGMDDGSDNILRPAQKQIGAASPIFDPKLAQLSQSDGDRVLLTFNYGAQHNAVIVAVLPHTKLTYGAKREDGIRRFQTHKGTSVATKSDGTYQIKRNDTTITLQANEEIEVKHKSGSIVKLLDSGDVQLIPARELLLGDDGLSNVTDGVVHGTAFDTFSGLQQWQLGGTSRHVLVSKVKKSTP